MGPSVNFQGINKFKSHFNFFYFKIYVDIEEIQDDFLSDSEFDYDKIVKNHNNAVEFYSLNLKKKQKTINQLNNNYIIKAYQLFNKCYAINIERPNPIDISTFLVWLVSKFSYATATIKRAIIYIKIFYGEKGFEMTDFCKAKLKQTYRIIKKTHANKNQNKGKEPLCYDDINFMINKMPSEIVFKRKYLACSLFLLQFYTASRSGSCLALRFKDVRIVFEHPDSNIIKSVSVTFQKTKTKNNNANLKRTIDINSNKQMCFINWFTIYLKNEFAIDMKNFNDIRVKNEWKDCKIWPIEYHTHNSLVQYVLKQNGIADASKYGTHSFRGGAVTEMLKRSLMEDTETGTNRFSHVFQEARTLGGWTDNSREFRKYFKNSMKSTIVASRFVDPNCKSTYIDTKLVQNLEQNNLQLKSKWKSDSEQLFIELFESIYKEIYKIFETQCAIKLTINMKQKIKLDFENVIKKNLLHSYAKQYNKIEYENLIIQDDNPQTRFSNVAVRIRKEIIIPLLENHQISFLIKLFNPLIESWLLNEKTKSTWAPEEDLQLIEQCVNEFGNISNLQMPNRVLWVMIIRLIVLKESYGFEYKNILENCKNNVLKKKQYQMELEF
jgi:hypothetical protein